MVFFIPQDEDTGGPPVPQDQTRSKPAAKLNQLAKKGKRPQAAREPESARQARSALQGDETCNESHNRPPPAGCGSMNTERQDSTSGAENYK
jgi:hypothetical protein